MVFAVWVTGVWVQDCTVIVRRWCPSQKSGFECPEQQYTCYSALIFPYGCCGHIQCSDSPVIKFLQPFENPAWKHWLCFLSSSLSRGVPSGFNMVYQFFLCHFSVLCAISRNTGTVHKRVSPNVPGGAPSFCGTEAGVVGAHTPEVAVGDCLPSTNVLPGTLSCTSAFPLGNRGAVEKSFALSSVHPWPHTWCTSLSPS